MKAAEKRRVFAERILEWHRKHARDLPWRRTRDPYAILVSEIMLQRTAARQVSGVYGPFMERYPTPSALAHAPLEGIEELIAPLGLRKRARRLKEIALLIEKRHGRKIPRNADELLDLPGVGRYTANAVLCFTFREDLPVVDANVIRVTKRVFSLGASTSRPRQDRAVWDFVARLIPKGTARGFNWGLLDFAAEICTAKKPKHEVCFLKDVCDYYLTKIGKKGE